MTNAGMSGVEGLVERYRDTMGLTREGAIRRMHVLMDTITDLSNEVATLQSQLVARNILTIAEVTESE